MNDIYAEGAPPFEDVKTFEEYLELRWKEDQDDFNGFVQRFKEDVESEKSRLTESSYQFLVKKEIHDMNEVWQSHKELIYFIRHYEYYDTLDRIEKGEALLKEEKNPDKARKYRSRLNELYIKLERLRPQEAIA